MTEFNKLPARAHVMPDLAQFKIIRETQKHEQLQPIVLVSMNTNSGECKNVAPYYVQLQKKFPRIYFLQISFQPYDQLINSFSNIPDLIQLNVAHDPHKAFQKFIFERNTLSIPYMFLFNCSGTIIFNGHPLSKQIESQLFKLSGQTLLRQTPKSPVQAFKQAPRGLSPDFRGFKSDLRKQVEMSMSSIK